MNHARPAATEHVIVVSELDALLAQVQSLLARVSSGQVLASPGFEQRLFGSMVALQALCAGPPLDIKTLVRDLSDS